MPAAFLIVSVAAPFIWQKPFLSFWSTGLLSNGLTVSWAATGLLLACWTVSLLFYPAFYVKVAILVLVVNLYVNALYLVLYPLVY